MYRTHPELYAYNITSKRHVLKSSVSYMRGIEKDPNNFVDSAEVLKDEVVPLAQGPKSAAPIPPPPIDTVAPLEQPKQVVKMEVPKVEEPNLKEMVAEMVRAEVRQNRAAYENKTPEDMEVLFRQMLISKLSKVPKQPHIDKVAAPAKKSVAAAKGKKMTFVVRAPQVSEDESSEGEE